MASRDYSKYAYLTIALEKDGPTYKALLKDAQEIDSKQLPTVAALALKHYYAGAQHHISAAAADDGQESSVARSNGQTSSIVVKNASKADANADAALDEWA
jgi:hypothetical protein